MTEPMASVDVASIPPIDHGEAMSIADVEAEKFAAMIAAIPDDQWHRPTTCSRWDVADLVAHVIGAAAAQASPREFVRQVRTGRPIRRSESLEFWWDGMNEVQVVERRGRTPDELRDEWSEVAPTAIRARRRLPRPIARLPLLRLPEPVGRQSIAYLFDMGFTRDVWMHRIDLASALGVDVDLDQPHDGRIVADIVAEWARTHGLPFELRLDGPAGGTYVSGAEGERLEISVPEFMQHLAERRSGSGLLSHPLPL